MFDGGPHVRQQCLGDVDIAMRLHVGRRQRHGLVGQHSRLIRHAHHERERHHTAVVCQDMRVCRWLLCRPGVAVPAVSSLLRILLHQPNNHTHTLGPVAYPGFYNGGEPTLPPRPPPPLPSFPSLLLEVGPVKSS